VSLRIGDKNLFIGHGDGLGPGDLGYKFTKRIFKSSFARWLFARLHPNFGIGLASRLSRASRSQNGHKDTRFLGEDKEYLIAFAKEYEKQHEVDYFVFGHRHFPMDIELPGGSHYINLGDWVQHFSYAEFNGNTLSLKYFQSPNS
jgi:UDP-2,3-diacylglucosamine hydrolase